MTGERSFIALGWQLHWSAYDDDDSLLFLRKQTNNGARNTDSNSSNNNKTALTLTLCDSRKKHLHYSPATNREHSSSDGWPSWIEWIQVVVVVAAYELTADNNATPILSPASSLVNSQQTYHGQST